MTEKRVDESWKENVNKEQIKTVKDEIPEQNNDHEHEMPPVDFNVFISSLGMQALMALGELENPITNKKEKELPQAKYLIDIIEMLQEKTKGNLQDQENKMLDQLLYELRMKFLSLTKE